MGHKPTILTAFAEPASGPGWSNTPVWYVLRDEHGKLTLECLQPEDQTPEMVNLYDVSRAAHTAMTRAVKRKS